MSKSSKSPDADERAMAALNLVETGFRHSGLEDLHAGVFPTSAIGDYSDVKVVTPYGEIAWADLSRLDDSEMKALMIQTVNRVYTLLTHPEPFSKLMAAGRWNTPELDPGMMDAVARWQARARGVAEDEIWATWPLDEAKRPTIRIEQRIRQDRATAADAVPVAPQAGAGAERWSFDATPDSLRVLAAAPLADAEWIAKAREALRVAADGWESAQLQVLDEIEAAGHAPD